MPETKYGKKFNKDSVEFKMLNDFWRILQDYYLPVNSDEYWESFIEEQSEFIKKYENHDLSRYLSRVLVNYLEAKMKKGEQNNG